MDYEKEYKKLKAGISKAYIYAQTDSTKAALETILPELKENEEEKMWKLIKKYAHCNISDMVLDADHITREQLESWLEKQHEQKHIDKIQPGKKYKCIASPRYSAFMIGKIYKPEDKFLCSLMNLCYDCFEQIEDEQKSADKVEPKFHEGDWVILTIGELSTTLQIVNVDTNKKLYWFNDSSYLPIVDEECLHLWTIADAKDGDVLVGGEQLFLFKRMNTSNSFYAHCNYNFIGYDCLSVYDSSYSIDNIYPATKEQRETLMKVMADAGYNFDFEKKKLKKIEGEFNGEDYGIDGLYHAQRILEKTLGKVDGYQSDDGMLSHKAAITAVKKLYKKKPVEWSEDDEHIRQWIISDINRLHLLNKKSPFIADKEIKWLKYLKQRIGE